LTQEQEDILNSILATAVLKETDPAYESARQWYNRNVADVGEAGAKSRLQAKLKRFKGA